MQEAQGSKGETEILTLVMAGELWPQTARHGSVYFRFCILGVHGPGPSLLSRIGVD